MVEPVMFLDTFKPKRDNVKEWVTHVVYSVNQKFKDCNPIDAYPCIMKCRGCWPKFATWLHVIISHITYVEMSYVLALVYNPGLTQFDFIWVIQP